LGAIGLAQGDSAAGLRAVKTPLRMLVTADDTTVQEVGGGKGLSDDLAATAFKFLKSAGLPMQDGSFDPLTTPFVSLDLWARGATKPDDPHDPLRAFNFQFQVFAPASSLMGRPKQPGRVTVWERSLYGVCPAEDVRDQVRIFLHLCDDFASDWRSAHGNSGPAKNAGTRGTGQADTRGQGAGK
jgi:hypothetical protein